jgi:hypothetical protein
MSKSVIFTKHALERKKLRKISNSEIDQTLYHPDQKIRLKPSFYKFIKTIDDRKLQIIAQYLKDQKKYLIISVWVRGEDDPTSLAWKLIILPFKLIWRFLKWLFSNSSS